MEHFKITQKVCFPEIDNLLVSALEGGSNYWYKIVSKHAPKKWEFWGTYNETKIKFLQLYPLNGGSLVIQDMEADEVKEYVLDRMALEKGLQVMAEKYVHHYCDMLSDNADAETGDVYLQCCLFNDVIYG